MIDGASQTWVSRIVLGWLALAVLSGTAMGAQFVFGTSNVLESSSAGADSVSLTVTPSSTSWTASASSTGAWLHTTASGTGSGSVAFSFDLNTGVTRTGTISVGGQSLTVVQAGTDYSGPPLVPATYTLLESPDSGTDTVTVAVTPANATYSAFPLNSWLHISSSSFSGSGNLVFTFDTNPGATRTGFLLIGSQFITVIQAGSTYTAAGGPFVLVPSGLAAPLGVAVDTSGNVYIADTNNNAIKKWTESTQTVSTIVSSGLLSPSAVAVDSAGNVYIADTGSQTIKKFDGTTLSTLVSSNAVITSYPTVATIADPSVPGATETAVANIVSAVESLTANIMTATESGTTVTITTPAPHGFSAGNMVTISLVGAGYNGLFFITAVPSTTTFQYKASSSNLANASGGTATTSGSAVTITTASPHGFSFGDKVAIANVNDTNYNGLFTISGVSSDTTFQYTATKSNLANASGGTATVTGSTATITTTSAAAPALLKGDAVTITGVVDTNNMSVAGYNGSFSITSVSSPTVFRYRANASGLPSAGKGSVVKAASPALVGIAVDTAGNVYMVDSANNTILKWTFATQLTSTLISGLTGASGVAVDTVGNLYISSSSGNSISKWTAATQTTTTLISTGLKTPIGVAVDGSGNVYISDAGSGAFKKWSAATQTLSTLAIPRSTSSSATIAASNVPGATEMTVATVATATEKSTATISTATESGTTVTITTSTPHGFSAGKIVVISGVGTGFDGTWLITSAPSTTTFQYTASASNLTGASTGTASVSGSAATLSATVSNAVESGTTVTITTTSPHGFTLGNTVILSGIGTGYDGSFTITAVQSNMSFQYTAKTSNLAGASSGMAFVTGITVTVTTTSPHGFSLNDHVTIANVDQTGYNGSFTISNVPTNTTFQFASSVTNLPAGAGGMATASGTTATITTTAPHGFTQGSSIALANVGSGYDGMYTILSIPSPTTFRFTAAAGLSNAGGGTVTATKFPTLGGVAASAIGNVYFTDTGTNQVEEQPNAFVDVNAKREPLTAGSDSLPAIIPTTLNLAGPFLPTSDQGWLSIGTITNGVDVVPFSFTLTGSVRTANITLLGRNVSVVQSASPLLIGVRSLSSDGYYVAGSTVSLEVNFSDAVNVTGAPLLTLATGSVNKNATYTSGNGGTTLTFTYNVQAGDASAHLDYLNTAALTLNGGTIKLASDNVTNAPLTLPAPGAAGSLSANSNLIIDTTPPSPPVNLALASGSDTGISASDGITKNTSPKVTGTAEANSTVTLFDTFGGNTTMLGSVAADSSGNWTIQLSALTEGTHSLTAKAKDAAGNVSVASTALPVIIDSIAPNAPVIAAPVDGSIGTNNKPTFSGTSEVNSTVNVYIDGALAGQPTADAIGNWSITPTSPLTEGARSVKASATDVAGNTSVFSAANAFTIDTTPPVATITSQPSNPTNSKSAAFIFKGTDTGGSGVNHLECALDLAPFATCTSPQNYSNLADGPHTFNVRGVDNAGNVSATMSYSWTIDTTPPVVTITSQPSNPANSKSATFTFNGTDTGGSGVNHLECALDLAPFATCTSPQNYSNLADGPHTFNVRGVDNAGNVSATMSCSWTIDTTPPVVTITSQPSNPTNSKSAAFAFNGTDTGGSGVNHLECALDLAPFANCTSPQNYSNLADGTYTFNVRGVDNAGNMSATKSYSWTINSIGPTVASVAVPADGYYRAGQVLNFTVTFTTNVTVTGTNNTLGLTIGAASKTAVFISKTANSVTYAYTVQSGDNDSDGITVGAIALNTTTIQDAATNNANVSLTGHVPSTVGILVNTMSPTALSIARMSPSGQYTNASSVVFAVTFSESVSGVDKTDFTLTLSGMTTTPPLVVAGNGASYTVTVNGVSGNGTLGLNLINDGTIKNVGGNPLAAGLTGPTYTVDQNPPSVTIGAPSQTSANKGDFITYLVTYFDTYFNSATLSANDITLNSSGGASASFSVSGSGSTRIVTLTNLSGNGTLGISIGAGTATDLAGNSASAPAPSATFSVFTSPLSIAISGPSVASSKTGPVSYTLTYSGTSGFTTVGAINIQNAIALNASLNATATVLVTAIDNAHYTVTLSNVSGAGTLGFSVAAGTASDGVGNVAGPAGPSATFLVNSLPVASVAFDNSVPKTNDMLTASVTTSDADNDPVLLTYVWKVNGAPKRTIVKTANVMDTFDLSVAGNGNKFDTITVEVTPNDGSANGTVATATETVVNTAPAVTGVQLSIVKHLPVIGNPSDALLLQSNDTLVAAVAAIDLDNDAVLLNYVWKVNGLIKKRTLATYTATDSLDLSVPGNGDAGDAISLEVTPSDGIAVGSTFSVGATVAVPTFVSPPTFSAGTAVAGLTVMFAAAANPADATVTWDFGDGSATLAGTAVQHIYAAAGNYTVTVTLQDPISLLTTTTTVSLTISGGNVLPGTAAAHVTKGSVKLTGPADSIGFKTTIPFPLQGDLTQLPLSVNIGGINQTIHFSKTGSAVNAPNVKAKLTVKSHRGIVTAQNAKLQFTISGANFKSLLSQGVAADSNGLPTKITIEIGFNGVTLSYVDTVIFKTTKKVTTGKFGFK